MARFKLLVLLKDLVTRTMHDVEQAYDLYRQGTISLEQYKLCWDGVKFRMHHIPETAAEHLNVEDMKELNAHIEWTTRYFDPNHPDFTGQEAQEERAARRAWAPPRGYR